MRAAFSNLIRVFIAMAMGLGFATWMPAGNGAAASIARQCGCSMCAGQPACCVVPEDPAPAPQPAAPVSRDASEGQPLTLAERPAVVVRMPEVGIVLQDVENVPCATVAGHSFQAVRCMWMV